MPLDVLDRILRPLRLGTATSRYPDAAPDLPRAARGLPELDAARCTGAAACVDACPTGAIRLTPTTWALDVGACIVCGACARACPEGALALGHVVELATLDRAALRVERTRGSGQ